MRSFFSMATVLLSALYFSLPAMPQAAGGADQNTPEALRVTYDRAMQAKDWTAAVATAQKLVDLHASADNLLLLGNAQLYSNAPQDSLATFDRTLAFVQQEKPPQGQSETAWKELIGKITIDKGNAYLRLHRNSDAIAAFNRAAEITPNPSLALWNLCATLYNAGDVDGAASACRKTTVADPTRADAWFVLGSVLYADAKLGPHGKIVITNECRQALDKYLELAPTGPHVADVKAMLDMVESEK